MEQWQVIGGGDTSLVTTNLTGDFLPAISKDDSDPNAAVWIPIKTALKIMQMPKVVTPFHADNRIKTYCEEKFPKSARRALGVTPAQRAEEIAKARAIIAAESKDIKWLHKMVQKSQRPRHT